MNKAKPPAETDFQDYQPAKAEPMLAYARELVLAGMCIALGLVIPLLFHTVGGGAAGRTFLPMFLPLLLLGLLSRWWIAALAGLITPMLSSLLTGMPPILPTAPMMMVELATMAAIASLMHRHLRLNVWSATVIALVASRAAEALMVMALGSWLAIELPWWIYVAATVAAGWPGIVLLIVLIPPLVLTIEKTSRFR